ncbi:MAG: transcriptional regulator, MarR family [Frankiales bacterium]|jgi:DNA-binding MarR family transcriptional regulator|nr:transcriptional regulator, MarR family [Frankiales bacterium]
MPDSALASTLRLSVMRLARRMRAERADTSLSLSQLAALATLDRHGPLAPGELAAHEKVQPPSMTRLVASLEAAALVTRAAHPTDGRQVLLSVAPAGRALLQEDRRRRDAWLSGQLRGLDPADREVLQRAVGVLERLASS